LHPGVDAVKRVDWAKLGGGLAENHDLVRSEAREWLAGQTQ
jgi:hypothetical protein